MYLLEPSEEDRLCIAFISSSSASASSGCTSGVDVAIRDGEE